MSEMEIRANLREWVLAHSKAGASEAFTDQSQIIEEGILTSLEIVELILFIESLRDEEIDVDLLEPESFESIDALISVFFNGIVTS